MLFRSEDLTEVLIHNASYAYANEITTQLKEAKNTDIIAAHGTGRVASEQPTGDKWMTGEFIRCFREGNAGPVMSAIDCGGPVGGDGVCAGYGRGYPRQAVQAL